MFCDLEIDHVFNSGNLHTLLDKLLRFIEQLKNSIVSVQFEISKLKFAVLKDLEL